MPKAWTKRKWARPLRWEVLDTVLVAGVSVAVVAEDRTSRILDCLARKEAHTVAGVGGFRPPGVRHGQEIYPCRPVEVGNPALDIYS